MRVETFQRLWNRPFPREGLGDSGTGTVYALHLCIVRLLASGEGQSRSESQQSEALM